MHINQTSSDSQSFPSSPQEGLESSRSTGIDSVDFSERLSKFGQKQTNNDLIALLAQLIRLIAILVNKAQTTQGAPAQRANNSTAIDSTRNIPNSSPIVPSRTRNNSRADFTPNTNSSRNITAETNNENPRLTNPGNAERTRNARAPQILNFNAPNQAQGLQRELKANTTNLKGLNPAIYEKGRGNPKIINDNFENGLLDNRIRLNGDGMQHTRRKDHISIVSNPNGTGNVLKTYTSADDPSKAPGSQKPGGQHRAELALPRVQQGQAVSYNFDYMTPDLNLGKHGHKIIMQSLEQGLSALRTNARPGFSNGSGPRFTISQESNGDIIAWNKAAGRKAVIANVDPGEWVSIQVDAVWSNKNNGFLQVSVDGKAAFTHRGANLTHSGSLLSTLGVYGVDGAHRQGVQEITNYYDNLRVALQ